MAGLLCRCGYGMESTLCPSPYKLIIYYKNEIDVAMQIDPNITLIDFLNNWSTLNNSPYTYMNRREPVEYWFCTQCNRVYEIQAKPLGHWLRIFKMTTDNSVNIDFNSWKQIFIFSDVDTDAATEKNINLTLNQYIDAHISKQYFLSPDESQVIVRTDNTLTVYSLEDTWNTTVLEKDKS